MRLKERKPAPALRHEVIAIERAGRWLGCYQGPVIGVKFVKDSAGALALFDGKAQARLAAADSLCRALDERAPMKITKEFIPPKRRARWKI